MSQASPIPVVIIGGYLGSGKTTLINQCLQNGLSNAAIIVNDFGDINIDIALISQFSSDTLELTNGCICCSIGDSLADTLFTVLDRPRLPELIVIETSGVSDPASVAAFTHIRGLTNAGILVLVDAVQAVSIFENSLVTKSFERQIRSAHLLALTKTDIASDDDVQAARRLLGELAPNTHVIEASASSLGELIDMSVEPKHSATPADTDHPLVQATHRFDSPVSLDDLRSFLDDLDSSVVRVKGIVSISDGSHVLVQKTGPLTSLTPTQLQSTGLVLIATK